MYHGLSTFKPGHTIGHPHPFGYLLCRLLERQKIDNGNVWPETVAVVLWGTDNIKTYGESLAQVSGYSCFRGWG